MSSNLDSSTSMYTAHMVSPFLLRIFPRKEARCLKGQPHPAFWRRVLTAGKCLKQWSQSPLLCNSWPVGKSLTSVTRSFQFHFRGSPSSWDALLGIQVRAISLLSGGNNSLWLDSQRFPSAALSSHFSSQCLQLLLNKVWTTARIWTCLPFRAQLRRLSLFFSVDYTHCLFYRHLVSLPQDLCSSCFLRLGKPLIPPLVSDPLAALKLVYKNTFSDPQTRVDLPVMYSLSTLWFSSTVLLFIISLYFCAYLCKDYLLEARSLLVQGCISSTCREGSLWKSLKYSRKVWATGS